LGLEGDAAESQNQREQRVKADVAQLVEQPIRNRQVSGSSPLVGSILSITYGQFTATCCTTAARAILASN
jgi:hypothetical protein